MAEKESADLLTKVDRAYQGGAGVVQLRSKQLSDRAMVRLGMKMREIARVRGKAFVVNDRIDIALAVGADAVHLGQDDLPIAYARDMIRQADSAMCVGISTHSLEQALQAEEDGADYIGVGPVFGTPTKPDYDPVGLDLVRQVRNKVKIPFVAIGGINLINADEVLGAGAAAIAVVRALFCTEDVYEAARKLREKIENSKKEAYPI